MCLYANLWTYSVELPVFLFLIALLRFCVLLFSGAADSGSALETQASPMRSASSLWNYFTLFGLFLPRRVGKTGSIAAANTNLYERLRTISFSDLLVRERELLLMLVNSLVNHYMNAATAACSLLPLAYVLLKFTFLCICLHFHSCVALSYCKFAQVLVLVSILVLSRVLCFLALRSKRLGIFAFVEFSQQFKLKVFYI